MLRWAADPQDKSVMVGAEEGVSVDSCRPPPPMGSGDSRKIRELSKMPQVVTHRSKPPLQGTDY